MKEYWNQIKEQFPKSFAQLCTDHDTILQWGEIDYPDTWGEHINEPKWVLRHLFDFFDARDICAYCYSTYHGTWYYSILTEDRYMLASNEQYINRESAELACYMKSFEKLEQQLIAQASK